MTIALETPRPAHTSACLALAAAPHGEPPVLFYGEADLQLTGLALPAGAPGLLRALVEAEAAPARERVVRQALGELGFEWMGCAGLRLHRGEWRVQSVMTTYAPPGWARRHGGVDHQALAPQVQPLLRTCLPLIWDLRDLADSPPRCVQALAESGVRSGVSLRLAANGAHGAEEFALVSLMSSRDDRGWVDDERLGQALTFILCVHEFLSRHAHAPRVASTVQADLSALQRRILQCLAQGQSDKQIAGGLNLSSHAVDYHLRQLRRRFAVRNRVQLVNAAARSH
ncbi:MAG: autoinducer binding domain-containing protein [Rhizobacter sp.]|nr:autoinducer binding domain-containing protein [Rhizobacter sp.]